MTAINALECEGCKGEHGRPTLCFECALQKSERAAAQAIENGFPNLDDSTEDDLQKIQSALLQLMQYIETLRDARAQRYAGSIVQACRLEQENDKRYNKLPLWARW